MRIRASHNTEGFQGVHQHGALSDSISGNFQFINKSSNADHQQDLAETVNTSNSEVV